MTVLQLRKAFDHIDRYVKTKNPDVGSFCKEWKKTFGKEVSKDAAEDYLKFVLAKGKGQAGGAMTPAPLGYDMRAGADIPHGSFPDYVSGGFGFANKSSFSGTTEQVPFPSPPADLGSNKVGGGKKNRKTKKQKKQRQSGGANGLLQSAGTIMSELFNRPFLVNPQSGNSQSQPYDIQMMAKGAQGPMGYPSPRPEIPTFSFNKADHSYAASISPSSVRF